jgi:hypothetical protein
MSIAEDLGKLILMMNPYTDGSDGSMQPHTFLALNPPPPPPSSDTTTGISFPSVPTSSNATCIWMEMDKYGTGDWSFKSQPYHINTALRIGYRWAKKDKHGNFLCWVTDYLLIGYAGANGG